MSNPPSTEDLRISGLRDGIAELMAECTEKQLAGLHRIHDSAPWKGLANCPVNKLGETYELLRRTVMSNLTTPGTTGAKP